MPSGERRSRAFHRRSKLGCTTCKAGHTRCDESKPTCLRCTKRGVSCSYPITLSGRAKVPLPRLEASQLEGCENTPSSSNAVGTQTLSTSVIRKTSTSEAPTASIIIPKLSNPQSSVNCEPSSVCGPRNQARRFPILEREELIQPRTAGSPKHVRSPQVASDEAPFMCRLPDTCELCSPYTISYIPPLLSGLTSSDVEIFHFYREIRTQQLPLAPSMHRRRMEAFPSAVSIARGSSLAKHSLMHVATISFVRLTGSTDPRFKLAISNHLGITLRGLQHAVDNLTAGNAESSLLATMNLSFMAANWLEWTTYIAGWSAIANYIQSTGQQRTVNPTFLPSRLWLKLTQPESVQSLPSPSDRSSCKFLVEAVVDSISRLKELMTHYDWRNSGFGQLQLLVLSMRKLNTLSSIDDVFSHLRLLQIWTLYIDGVKDGTGHVLGRLMKVHFYVLLLAVIPYFPPVCSTLCRRACKGYLEESQKDFKGLSPQMRKLARILWDSDISF